MIARTVFILYKGFMWLAIAAVVHSGLGKYVFAQAPGASLSASSVGFGSQNLGIASGSHVLTLTNTGSAALGISGIVLSGSFYGDFAANSGCNASLSAGASCAINISFTPTGTGTRSATLLVLNNATNSPQTVALSGTGVGSCSSISDCAFQVVNGRVAANRNSFFVYKDADSAFNHGIPSGLFGTIDLTKVTIDTVCIDDPASSTGCSTDPMRMDGTRGTVLRLTYPSMSGSQFTGLNIQEPENYSPTTMGTGYDLTSATSVQLEARSPDGATVQFGVGGCVTNFYRLNSSWSTINLSLVDLFPPPGGSAQPCPPDLTSTHLLFTIATNAAMSPAGGTVLLDNIQFLPVPNQQRAALSFPLGNLTFGSVLQAAITPDQANRNIAAIYESAATMLALLKRGKTEDVASALEIACAFDYALNHDNHGDALLVPPDGSLGLHSAYEGGDIALLNGQSSGSHAGDARLSGFSLGQTAPTSTCGPNRFCLVLDGATGGNAAWAMLALTAGWLQSGNIIYLNDAETIGHWITGTLKDPSATSYGGYFVGFEDGGHPQKLILGKSTENNGDVFAAFNLLAQIESARGNSAAAAQWTAAANVAGDFVMQMFDPAVGRFNAGTVDFRAAPDNIGNCQTPRMQKGNDVINTCDFLDSNTFTTLAMAAASRYRNQIDWRRPVQYVLDHFAQSITVAGQTFNGFNIVTMPTSGPNGVAWEFTGQAAVTMRFIDQLYAQSSFEASADSYRNQIRQAQTSAPFGDGQGLPASTIQNGDTLPPLNQCLSTPFQCIPERVGLAATTWAVFADMAFNPLGFSSVALSNTTITFPDQLVGTSSVPRTITLTSTSTASVVINGPISLTTTNSGFAESDNCQAASPLAAGASCTITITFTPSQVGPRTATLQIVDNALGSPHVVNLMGMGVPPDDFALNITPASQSGVAGNSASYTVNARITGNMSQALALSCAGLPCSVIPSMIASGQSTTLTVTPGPGTVPGSYPLTVTAVGTSITRMASATLSVASPARVSSASLSFGSQAAGTVSGPQTVSLTNTGPATLAFSGVVLTGSFSGDFAQNNNCGSSVAPAASCNINVTFAPTGTGGRKATLLIVDSAGDSPQPVQLTGAGTSVCGSIGDCGLRLLNQRASAGQNTFYVYKDADSGSNHGFPSGLFGNPGFDLNKVTLDSGCIDSPTSSTGCASTNISLDATRGTVLRIAFPPLGSLDFVGLNFEDPQNYDPQQGIVGNGYDLSPATAVQFDARSPDGATVQFGVGGCVTGFFTLSPFWTTMTIPLSTLSPPPPGGPTPVCPPGTGSVRLLFAVVTNGTYAPAGGTVLLDNVRFTPVPARQTNAASFPLSSHSYGVIPQQHLPIPSDQVNRNLTTTYESGLTALALLQHGQPADVKNALEIVNTLDYALNHDNHGDPIPVGPGSSAGCYSGALPAQCGLHSGYIDGDIAFLNNQPTPALGQAGDVRLAGFSSGNILCGQTGFCLVLDGAAGGSNAWAMLAFLGAWRQSHNAVYLNDARAIGTWIVANLADTSGTGYGGYFVGYTDGGVPKQLIVGKSTRYNAEIFAAFSVLAQVESTLGNSSAAALWTNRANAAGDFVIQMFDSPNGRLNAGTVNIAATGSQGPGLCPDATTQKGNDVVNTCDSLDSDTIATLSMAAAPRYQNQIDWGRIILYVVNHFAQTVSAGGQPFSGFNLVRGATPIGVAWEFTGQTVAAMKFADAVYNRTQFSSATTSYLDQIHQAQISAPFGDGQGIVAATLQSGDTLVPNQQCLPTPFQCIAERVGLAATAWGLLAEASANPLSAFSPAPAPVVAVVVNAASFQAPLARGALATIFGSNLASGTAQASEVPLTTRLGGVQVSVAGKGAPLVYVSPAQINFQVPFEAPTTGTVAVVVNRDGTQSAPQSAAMAEYAPGVFTYARNSTTLDPVIVHLDNSLVTPSSPASANEVLVIYATGVGSFDHPPTTGAAASGSPLAMALVTPTVKVGGSAAQVLFAGLTPGFVGLVQINIQLAATLPLGSTLPLVVAFGSSAAPAVNLSVR